MLTDSLSRASFDVSLPAFDNSVPVDKVEPKVVSQRSAGGHWTLTFLLLVEDVAFVRTETKNPFHYDEAIMGHWVELHLIQFLRRVDETSGNAYFASSAISDFETETPLLLGFYRQARQEVIVTKWLSPCPMLPSPDSQACNYPDHNRQQDQHEQDGKEKRFLPWHTSSLSRRPSSPSKADLDLSPRNVATACSLPTFGQIT